MRSLFGSLVLLCVVHTAILAQDQSQTLPQSPTLNVFCGIFCAGDFASIQDAIFAAGTKGAVVILESGVDLSLNP